MPLAVDESKVTSKTTSIITVSWRLLGSDPVQAFAVFDCKTLCLCLIITLIIMSVSR